MRQLLGRMLGVVLVLTGVVVIVFVMLRVIPGDPATVLLNEHVSQANIERLTQSMGLDKSLPEQFIDYMAGILRGDLGRSYYLQQPVSSLLMDAFPYTLRLTLLSVFF